MALNTLIPANLYSSKYVWNSSYVTVWCCAIVFLLKSLTTSTLTFDMNFFSLRMKKKELDLVTFESAEYAAVLWDVTSRTCSIQLVFNERKWLHSGKSNMQTIPRTDYYACGLRWWHSASANTPAMTEYLLEWAAGRIGLYVNAGKTEYICFNERSDISTLDGGSLKLVDHFTYVGSSVSSTENDINMQWVKAWTAIVRLSVRCESDLSEKIKQSFLKQRSCAYFYMEKPYGRRQSV